MSTGIGRSGLEKLNDGRNVRQDGRCRSGQLDPKFEKGSMQLWVGCMRVYKQSTVRICRRSRLSSDSKWSEAIDKERIAIDECDSTMLVPTP
ncbi:Uncharacterized protein HZ326_21585 [Fusarium oxysporum f. sp. albedinis]|nr:Uncharacterized protein HZ326_21585 [Fusarium oxysporum f. sp. albedinis]